MSKASSVAASVTQQSRQRVPQSWTEYRERSKATGVQTVCGTQSAARYWGAVLMRQQWVKMMTLYLTSSQWRLSCFS